jgi:hypothetical protein
LANVLKSIEKKIENLVEGVFGRAFKSSVQPVEIAHKLAKEMGDHKTVSVSKVYVPNEYEVYLSPADYEQMHAFEASLVEELSTYLIAYARREGWTLVSKPHVSLHGDDDLHLGEFGIATRTVTEPEQPVVAPVAPPQQLSQTVVYQPPAPAPAAPVPVVPPGPATCAVLRWGAGGHDLSADVTLIGRNKRCDVVLADPNVSRQHAEIRREGDDYVVIDLDSTNGVQLNGKEVKRARLADGDRLTLGTSVLRFERRPC